jgi:hypothetical protein
MESFRLRGHKLECVEDLLAMKDFLVVGKDQLMRIAAEGSVEVDG